MEITMKHKLNLSNYQRALYILTLDEPMIELVMEILNLWGSDISSEEDSPPFNAPDIMDFKRSQPFGLAHFIEQSAILRIQGYQMREFDSVCTLKCATCDCKTVANIEYAKRNQITDTINFELCLSCYTGYKLTPIYAPEVGGV